MIGLGQLRHDGRGGRGLHERSEGLVLSGPLQALDLVEERLGGEVLRCPEDDGVVAGHLPEGLGGLVVAGGGVEGSGSGEELGPLLEANQLVEALAADPGVGHHLRLSPWRGREKDSLVVRVLHVALRVAPLDEGEGGGGLADLGDEQSGEQGGSPAEGGLERFHRVGSLRTKNGHFLGAMPSSWRMACSSCGVILSVVFMSTTSRRSRARAPEGAWTRSSSDCHE